MIIFCYAMAHKRQLKKHLMLEKLKQFFMRFFPSKIKKNEDKKLLEANQPLAQISHQFCEYQHPACQNRPLQKTNSPADDAHQLPITNRIKAWLDEEGWRYEHHLPTENASRTQHLILGFTNKNSQEWTCIFRINESNQLVTLFGIIQETVLVCHYAQTLVEISRANLNIGYGNIELDPYDGELRVKISFDGEFTSISDRMLSCYMQAVSSLVDIAYAIIKNAQQDSTPSHNVNDYLELTDEVDIVINDQHQKFFVATTEKQ